jgi:hypothetical protein
MATLTKNFSPALERTNSISLSSRYDQWIETIKFSYYGIISMTMIIGSCLGGIATMYVFQNDAPIWQFVLATAISMANNVAAISQAPMKWVVNIFALTVIINAILIIANLG